MASRDEVILASALFCLGRTLDGGSKISFHQLSSASYGLGSCGSGLTTSKASLAHKVPGVKYSSLLASAAVSGLKTGNPDFLDT